MAGFHDNLDRLTPACQIIPDFTAARAVGCSGVAVVTTRKSQKTKLQLYHHHQRTHPQFILQARCPSCHPTNSVKATRM